VEHGEEATMIEEEPELHLKRDDDDDKQQLLNKDKP
jgi:hypothetical protein